MITEVNEAKEFLKEKYGDLNSVPPGTYAIPTDTSKGPAFMKVIITEEKFMKGFDLYWDEEFKHSWHNPKPESPTTEDLKIECTASLIALYVEVESEVAADVKKHVDNYTGALLKTIEDLKIYVKHLPTCNIMQDWYEADDAMSRTPESMRDEGFYIAQEEIERKKKTCICGLEELLK